MMHNFERKESFAFFLFKFLKNHWKDFFSFFIFKRKDSLLLLLFLKQSETFSFFFKMRFFLPFVILVLAVGSLKPSWIKVGKMQTKQKDFNKKRLICCPPSVNGEIFERELKWNLAKDTFPFKQTILAYWLHGCRRARGKEHVRGNTVKR